MFATSAPGAAALKRFVYVATINHRLNSWQHALQRAAARITYRVDDVRHVDEIAVADVVSGIDRRARRRIAKAMQALRKLFVNVPDHRILLFRIEVIRFEKQTFQRYAVR